jgi:hypothetical protein
MGTRHVYFILTVKKSTEGNIEGVLEERMVISHGPFVRFAPPESIKLCIEY